MKQLNFGITARDAKSVEYFRSQSAAARAGYCQQAVSLCLAGKRQTHGSKEWSHATPYDRFREFATLHLQGEANGRAIGDSEMWEAYIKWVPAEWLPYMRREDFRVPNGAGRFWILTAPP